MATYTTTTAATVTFVVDNKFGGPENPPGTCVREPRRPKPAAPTTAATVDV